MCGIIGYSGSLNATDIVINGLQKLEYRGYDSFGIATLNNKTITITKKVGAISTLAHTLQLPPSALAIGHTRWATHGPVTEANAHPHTSNDGTISVIHNGIIDNWQELKTLLQQHNFSFLSQTDTEVIPNLIQFHTRQGISFQQAFLKTIQQLQGTFAILALHNTAEEIAFAKNSSPLIIGKGEHESYYVASDITAFAHATTNIFALPDNTYGFLGKDITIYSTQTHKTITPLFSPVTLEEEQEDEKTGHALYKEILEQPRILQKIMEYSENNLKTVAHLIQNAKTVYITGCGTSFHAALTATHFFAQTAHIRCIPFLSSEVQLHKQWLQKDTVLIALSQSGETADVISAVKTAKEQGTTVIALVNMPATTLTRLADHTLYLHAGTERSVLSTKTFTAQLALLFLLAHTLSQTLEQGRTILQHTQTAINNLLAQEHTLTTIATATAAHNNYFLIGRDTAYPCALEGALKIKEVSYIHAEGFAGGELKHGTLALIQQGIPVIILTTPTTRQQTLSNAMEIKSRGGLLIGIDTDHDPCYDYFIKLPPTQEHALLLCIPLQLLAYHLAILRGCDPDKPRNLAKSVTVH